MKKVLGVAILAAFVVALVAETALFALGKTGDLGSLIELGAAWAVVLAGFVAGVVRLLWGVPRSGVGVVAVFHRSEPEDEAEDEAEDEPENETEGETEDEE